MAPWGVTGSQTAVLSYKTLPSSSVACSDVFYDKGIDGANGSVSSYNNDESWIYTYYPVDPVNDAIQVAFQSFNTAPGDILYIYNGNSINAPLINLYSGPSISIALFMSTANDGSITFQFTSDDTLISTGWQANVSCVASLGTGNADIAKTISIVPNPVKDQLTVHSTYSLISAAIFNLLGEMKLISNMTATKNIIDISSLQSGIYIVELQSGNKFKRQKLIKE